MPRITRAALIQCSNALPGETDLKKVKSAMIEKHLPLIARAADEGAKVCCLQEQIKLLLRLMQQKFLQEFTL